ncbi:UDP-Gal or UDP-GlcNAc-dependent glycosyltransferase [Trypanosoma theileri]|uniref:Hexosyltransferase n=1 Tax=Trypanosoma theileri TaxID=67003 RepID=A0A1X0NJF0_9TRYP|nr:UDP-Gal or UDP-GlcNAc-dependent glycosyltransferase [Trypanosoma theileri]ORC84767.1 UDP-Gal or UDP-GlcNAc-dependent glycosyltransferase [Trypanosoma theileri]
MLVLYVLARHPSQGYKYSESLLKEVAEYHDVITLSMNEGRVTTNKSISGNGKWGLEAEVGMSRKTYFWLEMALRLFPSAKYIAKGDDDMFLRVPQFLAELTSLPTRGLYWGILGRSYRSSISFTFAFGACYTLALDVAKTVVSFGPLRRVVYVPFTASVADKYYLYHMDGEDAMVGCALKLVGYTRHLIFASEPSCSFHDIRSENETNTVSSNSIMVHHLLEEDYVPLMRGFMNTSTFRRRIKKSRRKKTMYFSCLEE